MSRRIEDAVAENRDGRRRLDAYVIETGAGEGTGEGDNGRDGPSGGPQAIITGNELRVGVLDVAVYTRELGSGSASDPQLTVGHSDPEHGVGRGVVGDRRGKWTRVESATVESSAVVADGKRRLLEGLVGTSGSITAVEVGSGTTPADPGDAGLETSGGSGVAFASTADRPDSAGIDEHTATARGLFRFHEFGDTVTEVGAKAGETLVTRSVVAAIDPTPDEELRVDITLRVGADAVGDTAFTDSGEAALAASVVNGPTVALDTVAIGSGDAATTDGDTALDTEIDRHDDATTSSVGPQGVGVRSSWTAHEPTEQPVTIREIGVLDAGGNLVWRAVVQSHRKTETGPYTAGMTTALREG